MTKCEGMADALTWHLAWSIAGVGLAVLVSSAIGMYCGLVLFFALDSHHHASPDTGSASRDHQDAYVRGAGW
mgnify:CR=1 FL=1